MTQKLKEFSLDKEKIYHFGLDHLEVYASFLFPYLFEGLDFENSNYAEFWEYTIVKHEVQRYEYKIEFIHESIPLFAYYIWQDRGDKWISTKNYLCVYASAFRVLGPEKIKKFIYSYFEPELMRRSPVKRFDICIDVLEDINTIIGSLHNINQKWAIFIGGNGKIETRYIWEKCNSKNKRHLIRIYDKIKDILHKKKHTLYSDYLSQKNVTRVEIEIRRELAQNIWLDKLFDTDILMGLLKNYLDKHTDIFKDLEGDKITLYRKQEKIDYETIQSKAYWEFRTKLFISYAKSLIGIWVCPVEILLFEWHVQGRTKIRLWFEDYLAYMKEMKTKEYWYHRQFPNKKDN